MAVLTEPVVAEIEEVLAEGLSEAQIAELARRETGHPAQSSARGNDPCARKKKALPARTERLASAPERARRARSSPSPPAHRVIEPRYLGDECLRFVSTGDCAWANYHGVSPVLIEGKHRKLLIHKSSVRTDRASNLGVGGSPKAMGYEQGTERRAEGFSFESGKADLSPAFKDALSSRIIPEQSMAGG